MEKPLKKIWIDEFGCVYDVKHMPLGVIRMINENKLQGFSGVFSKKLIFFKNILTVMWREGEYRKNGSSIL